ncbi:MAG: TonB-dependent receptor [Bacteroidales bacterium]|jgi:hemoglobin/transferrin/lactoferrin receptor protein
MKKYIFIFATILYSIFAFSQNITVVDKITRQPIPGIVVHSKDLKVSATTNANGQVNISAFKGKDSIYFHHMVYTKKAFSYAQIEAMKFNVELSEITISLNELVVSANRWEEEQIEIPYRIEKINAKEVSFQNPQTSADLLGSGGYAYIQKSQLAGGSPSLRGFATNRIMLVVDGVRMNNAIFRTGNLQNIISIDAASIENTEILFGPGAVMYGSDAIGGVMDFHTLQPKLADSSKKLLFKGNVFGRFSSANTEKTYHLDFNIGLKKLSFVTSFSQADYGDLRAGTYGNSYFLRPVYQKTINGIDSQLVNTDKQLQISSGYSQTNLMQKIRFKPNESWDFDYAIHYSATSDAPRYDRLYLDGNNDGKLDNAQWYYGPQKWMMNRIGITNSKPNKLYNQLRFVAAMQNYEESRHDRKFNNKKLRNQTETVDALSFNLDMDKRIGKKATLFYGAEVLNNSVGSVANKVHIETGAEEPTNTRYPNGSTWQAYGAYTSLKYKFNPKWIMSTGLRYSYYIIEADFDTTMFPFPFTHAENSNGALNGSLGFVYSPNQTWQMYINGSTGFRAPNIDDIGKVFSSEPGSVVVPNTNLSPEYAYNGEIGTAKTFGNFLKVDFATYYTLLNNALARRNFQFNGQDSIIYDGDMSRVQAIQNITKAYVYGIQAGADISFGKGIGLRTTICYQQGEEQSEDSLIYYPISHIAPMFGSTHLTYERKKLKLDFYASYNSKMDYKDLPLADRIDNTPYAKDANGLPFVPGWYTLNFKVAFYFNKYLGLNAGVENITDQLYRPFGSGISAPGRNFIVTLRANI